MQTGNSVSPLDKTYHGGPRTIWMFAPIVNGSAPSSHPTRGWKIHETFTPPLTGKNYITLPRVRLCVPGPAGAPAPIATSVPPTMR